MAIEFSSTLRKERSRLQMTQEEVAELCGITLRAYSDWENKKAEPLDVAKEGALERMRKTQPKIVLSITR